MKKATGSFGLYRVESVNNWANMCLIPCFAIYSWAFLTSTSVFITVVLACHSLSDDRQFSLQRICKSNSCHCCQHVSFLRVCCSCTCNHSTVPRTTTDTQLLYLIGFKAEEDTISKKKHDKKVIINHSQHSNKKTWCFRKTNVCVHTFHHDSFV